MNETAVDESFDYADALSDYATEAADRNLGSVSMYASNVAAYTIIAAGSAYLQNQTDAYDAAIDAGLYTQQVSILFLSLLLLNSPLLSQLACKLRVIQTMIQLF